MGLELQAIDLEAQRKRAESQDRADHAATLAEQLGAVLDDLARVSENIPVDLADIDAPRAADG